MKSLRSEIVLYNFKIFYLIIICISLIKANDDIHKFKLKLSSNDKSILNNEYLNTLPKSDYSFLINYLDHEDKYVRLLALKLCRKIKPANFMDIYLKGLTCGLGSRTAAQGILESCPKDDYEKIIIQKINEICNLKFKFPESTIDKLILTLGNIATLTDIFEIEQTVLKLNEEKTTNAFLWAKAKLGDSLSVDKLKQILIDGNGRQKGKALDGIKYIGDPLFVSYIAPLLWDTTFIKDECSDGSMPVYVSGKTINVLHAIDKGFKKIKGVPNKSGYYHPLVIELVRRYYSEFKPCK